MKISIKKSTFDFIIKKLKPASKLRSWKIEKLRLDLINSLKNRFLVKTIYGGNLHHLPLRMLKVYLAIADNFNWQFFLARQP